MTVLIGLRCKDGAVFACDSQETRANYFRYWPKTRVFQNQFVVLYAGSPTIGEAFFRRLSSGLRELMKDRQIDQLSAAQLVEKPFFLWQKRLVMRR